MEADDADGVGRALDAARAHDFDALVREVDALLRTPGDGAIRLLAAPALREVLTAPDEPVEVVAARLRAVNADWAPDLGADLYEVAVAALRGDATGIEGLPPLVVCVAFCVIAVSLPAT